MTEEEVADWLAGGSGYEGREATVTGQVFNSERDGDKAYYQIHTDPDNYEGNTVVYFEGSNPGIGNDDYIRATGIVAKDFTGENAFGGEVTAKCLNASTIEKIDYIDAVAPTTAEVKPAATSEINGYSITIDKVEFSDKETRVYVTLTNNGAGRLSVYDYDAVIIQNGRQFNAETNYSAGYPDINKELAIGASMSGVMTFPVIEQSDFQIQMHGYSDNYEVDQDALDFSFDITV